MVVSVDQTDDFKLLNEGSVVKCICGKSLVTVDYSIQPLVLGRNDFALHISGKQSIAVLFNLLFLRTPFSIFYLLLLDLE